MPYRKGDIVEINREGQHGFPVGTKVTVTEVVTTEAPDQLYKVDRDNDGRKRSRYVSKLDLIKRRNPKA